MAKARDRRRTLDGFAEINHDAAGIDVGNAQHWVAVPAGRDGESVRMFGCFTADLHALANWLERSEPAVFTDFNLERVGEPSIVIPPGAAQVPVDRKALPTVALKGLLVGLGSVLQKRDRKFARLREYSVESPEIHNWYAAALPYWICEVHAWKSFTSPNSMVAGALLAQAGWRVSVLERSQELGGALPHGSARRSSRSMLRLRTSGRLL